MPEFAAPDRPLGSIDSYPEPADAPALRWGILGPGGIARRFASEIPRFTASRVLAVGSRDLGRAEQFASEFGVARAYGSYAELVSDPEVDVVYIATPHSEHRAHALAALEAGKPVLVEKAFARNADEAREVFDVAASRGLFAMEAMWSRFLPHYRAVVDSVKDGLIGEVVSVIAQHGQDLVGGNDRLWRPELAGGALLDLGVYPLSLMHALLGVPDQVAAFGSLSEAGIDLGESVVLRYGERTFGVAVSSLEAAMQNDATIAGTKGRLHIKRTFYAPSDVVVMLGDGTDYVAPLRHEGGFQFQAAEVARCLAAGRTSSDLMSWQDTVDVMEIMDEVRAQLGVVYPGERLDPATSRPTSA